MTASGTTDNLEDKALQAMTEPKRRKASEMPPYRPTADRLADLEERIEHLLTWQAIGEQRDAAMQGRIAALEIEVVHLKAANEHLSERLQALEQPKTK